MTYRVTLATGVNKAILKLPRVVRSRIESRLVDLGSNPHPMDSVKLKGRNEFRVRVGDYRIIYAIFDRTLVVLIVDVGHRREVYRRK